MRTFMLKLLFPGSLEEYAEAKKIHFTELRTYRRRWHFVLGWLLIFVPSIAVVVGDTTWLMKIGALSMICGFLFIQDTIAQHYCIKLIRERKPE